jgi:site-specific DNA-cytosine methylase
VGQAEDYGSPQPRERLYAVFFRGGQSNSPDLRALRDQRAELVLRLLRFPAAALTAMLLPLAEARLILEG